MSELYRGVSARHPALQQALRGLVVPGALRGTVTPEEHNAGGVAARSPYTSWTRTLEVARFHALKDGPGGVVLRLLAGHPPRDAAWAWAGSPDIYYEDEVLLRGSRDDAIVFEQL